MKPREHSPSSVMSITGNQQSVRECVHHVKFEAGIPGFAELRECVFLTQPEIQPFFCLRALSIEDLVFVCVEPFIICPWYTIDIPDHFAESLGMKRPEDAWIISLVTVAEEKEETTANLMCPIVINVQTMLARQLILEQSESLLRYKIWNREDADERERELMVS